MIGIYKITNPFNQVYIGQSIDIERRIQSHKDCNCSNYHLVMSMQKHGIENHTFEVLEECDRNDLIKKERYYLSIYKKDYLLFNYSIYLFWLEGHFNLINDCDYGINSLIKIRNEKEINKQLKSKREVSLNIKIMKTIKDNLGVELCKEIAENAVNTEYRKRLKNKER